MGKISEALEKARKNGQTGVFKPPLNAPVQPDLAKDTITLNGEQETKTTADKKSANSQSSKPVESRPVKPAADSPNDNKGRQPEFPASEHVLPEFLEAGSEKKGPVKTQPATKADRPADSASIINPNLIVYHKPSSFESEQFKMLRTSLLLPNSGVAPRSMMVTSVFPGEGKSFVAANLAVSIAQNIKEHVLLMECDIRKPCLHEMFGYNANSQGLSEYLAEDIPLHSVLIKSRIRKLTILPGGQPPDNPSELLSSERMFGLLSEVQKRYSDRYIVIDSPPPHLTAEASALARQVDGIIVVIRYGDTPREAVIELLEKFESEKIIGIVLNQIDGMFAFPYDRRGYRKYRKYYSKNH